METKLIIKLSTYEKEETIHIKDLRRKVNDTLEDWISELNIPILLVSGTLENRKKQVLNYLIKLQS